METVVERGRIFFPVSQVLARVLRSLGSMKRGTGTSLSSVWASWGWSPVCYCPVFLESLDSAHCSPVPDCAVQLSWPLTFRIHGALVGPSKVLWQQRALCLSLFIFSPSSLAPPSPIFLPGALLVLSLHLLLIPKSPSWTHSWSQLSASQKNFFFLSLCTFQENDPTQKSLGNKIHYL